MCMISSCRYNELMRILPEQLYSASSVANIDRNAIEVHKIPGYTLMRRAGQAVFDFIEQKFTTPVSLLVVCGAGNQTAIYCRKLFATWGKRSCCYTGCTAAYLIA